MAEIEGAGTAYAVKAAGSPYLHAGLSLVIPLGLTAAYLMGIMTAPPGGLADSDGYMHLLRAEKLWRTGHWHDSVIERSNAPYGEQLHWTRPMDVLLLGGALPVAGLLGFRSALFWWGVLVSPVLLFASLLILPWTARPLVTKDGPRLTVLFMVCQLGVLSVFQPARPDHHSLLALLFVLSLGLTLRLVLAPLRLSLCYGAAAVCALSIWVSIEALVVTATVLAALGWLWVRRNADFLPKGVHFSLTLFLLTCLATLVERPWSDLVTVEFDRLSIIHCVLFGLIASVFAAAWLLSRMRPTGPLTGWTGRLVLALAGIVVVVLALAALSPRFFRGPLADVAPQLVPLWLERVRELQPLSSQWCFSVPLLGATALAVPFVTLWSVRRRNADGWAYVGFSILLFLALSLYQLRWVMYTEVLLSLALAELRARHLVRPSDPGYTRRNSIRNIAVLGGCCYGLMFSGLLVQTVIGAIPSPAPYSRAALQGICEYLVTTPRWQDRPHRILTHVDLGSEILYRTPHEVIGTPYQRNARGLLDTQAILSAPSFPAALPLLLLPILRILIVHRPVPARAGDAPGVQLVRGELKIVGPLAVVQPGHQNAARDLLLGPGELGRLQLSLLEQLKDPAPLRPEQREFLEHGFRPLPIPMPVATAAPANAGVPASRRRGHTSAPRDAPYLTSTDRKPAIRLSPW